MAAPVRRALCRAPTYHFKDVLVQNFWTHMLVIMSRNFPMVCMSMSML